MKKIQEKQDWFTKDVRALFAAVLMLKDINEARIFFRDLLTEKEIEEFGRRWKVVRMLAVGDSYKSIEEETKMSSTTIARIHAWMKKGAGGYRRMLNKTR
ncbi:MAG: TrpR-like protein YerC/YecD [Patescibacteria group bacterium]|nr:TrpR-like protein YerC/YecD [Patescibacteria group bacterium]MDE2438276.1 TrpR-like protein YerC/YecD [Patescibacteria group bacterium]